MIILHNFIYSQCEAFSKSNITLEHIFIVIRLSFLTFPLHRIKQRPPQSHPLRLRSHAKDLEKSTVDPLFRIGMFYDPKNPLENKMQVSLANVS